MSKFLIVGLGNVGEEYAHTRHNIGFDVLDHLAKETGAKFKNDRLADVAEVKYKGKTLILVKPTTFMNLSGKAVNYWMQAEKIGIDNVMVIVDDLALPLGKIAYRTKRERWRAQWIEEYSRSFTNHQLSALTIWHKQ